MNLAYGLSLHEFSVAQVDSVPAWCFGVIEIWLQDLSVIYPLQPFTFTTVLEI